MKGKYETCVHAEKAGQTAVYVRPSCPRATMVKGYLVSSKKHCKSCKMYKEAGK